MCNLSHFNIVMLNRDITNNRVDIYNISSHKGLKGELDTRLLTEDGRNQIKEDVERSKRLGKSIADVATSDAFELKDTFNHIDEVQKDLDVQKAFALQNNGKGIETLQGKNSTIEQKQKAIQEYAQIYADVYGINIEEANIIATNKFIKGAHYSNDNKKSIIDINDNAQTGAQSYAKTMGHEITHARVAQGVTRDRESSTLNEEYANIMGSYSSNGMEFSSSTYNSVNLNTNTNKHMQTADDKKLLSTNNNNLKERIKKDADNVKFESYWDLGDIDRMNTISDPKTPIERTINALVATGLSPQDIKKSLAKLAKFKALVKDGDAKFNAIYAEQKAKVDGVNRKVDATVHSLQAAELALGGREVVKNVVEAITKKSLEFSIKNAVKASGVDILMQVKSQIENNPNLISEFQKNPESTMMKIYKKIDLLQTATSAGIGSTGIKTSENLSTLKKRVEARQTIQQQLTNVNSSSKSQTKINKLTKRLSEKTDDVINSAIILTTPYIVKEAMNTNIDKMIKENIPLKDTNNEN